MCTPSTDEKTVSFKVFRDNVPRFSITYKDKKDLYESFKKKIAELDFEVGNIYWIDFDGDQSLIENADDLFTASKDNCTVKLFARVDDDVISCSDDEPEHPAHGRRQKRATMRNRRRNRDRTRSRSRSRTRSGSRGRSRSRSGSRSRSRKHSRGHRHGHGGPPHFGPFGRMRDFYDRPPFFGPWDFPPRAFFEGRRGAGHHGRGGRHGCGPRGCPWACWGPPPF
ncbi:hypothetical protein Y032_0522g2903 [Ancylostoma ceylanicum]|uniref:PB1 domain-containing protein n=1 Tax=Ancylostoma ceylanicum TaxID=53326 RepID=A0A016WSU8_9BILA|nr:hypothetical protein Y032_0522g2903 [Ancylostoma ceylanicum]